MVISLVRRVTSVAVENLSVFLKESDSILSNSARRRFFAAPLEE